MKKLLLVSIAVLMLSAIALPAFAAWDVSWTEGFESYSLGNVPGPYTSQKFGPDQSAKLPAVIQNTNVRTGFQAMADVPALTASKTTYVANKVLAGNRKSYNGWARAYMWDSGDNRPSGNTIGNDVRFGVHSSVASSAIGGCATANLTDGRSTAYWGAQWSYSVATMDGVTPVAGGTGYTFTVGQAAPRVFNAWSMVLIKWGFTYTGWNYTTGLPTGGSGWIEWYINSPSVASLRLDVDSTSGRWANLNNVTGLVFGSVYGYNGPGGAIDDIDFRGNVTPEPSGMVALGAGLMGLMGFIRRRR